VPPIGSIELATPQVLVTADGERLTALHLSRDPDDRSVGLVVAHGFTGSLRRPMVRAVIERLARYAGVVAFDARGHGGSTGRSTLGLKEMLDVDAAVLRARELGYQRVVTCGWSMGATAVLRHAAFHRNVDAVVAVSAVSRWVYRETRPVRRLEWLVGGRAGRLVAQHALRTRIARDLASEPLQAPVDVVGLIAPTPLLLVHGDRDTFFPVEHPRALAAAAGAGCELWIVPGFGHAEAGATPELLDRIGRHLPVLLSRAAA
jgi:pimeloyl-ACP methyl ester carboxylesterase